MMPWLLRRMWGRGSGAALAFWIVGFRSAEGQTVRDDAGRAEELFRSGAEKFDAARYEAACGDFAESFRLEAKLGTLLNLALCHEVVGKFSNAWKEFHHASAWAARNNQRDRHDFALQHVVALERRLNRVAFRVPSGTAVAAYVDGELVQEAGLPLYLDPGEHEARFVAREGQSTFRFKVSAAHTEQAIAVPPFEARDDETQSRVKLVVDDPDRARRMLGWAGFGVATGGAVLGFTIGALAVSERDAIGAHCSGERCDAVGAAHYREAQSRANVATVALGLSVAVAAGAAVLVLTSRGPIRRAQLQALRAGAALGIEGSF